MYSLYIYAILKLSLDWLIRCYICLPFSRWCFAYSVKIGMAVEQGGSDQARERALADYRRKLIEHREIEARLKEGMVVNPAAL